MGKALCDSRSSINLMPLSVVKRLSLGELTPTTTTLQMVGRILAQLEGILEDVLIKVGKFIFLAQPEDNLEDVLIKVGKYIFPVDVVVIDIEEDKQVPLLLERSFLTTRAALIDVKKGEITPRVGDEAVHFNLNQSLKQSEFDNSDCKIVETKVPINFELINDCKTQISMNENETISSILSILMLNFLTPILN